MRRANARYANMINQP